MKKVTFLMALAVAAGMASCTAQSPKADLKTDIDSLSYAIGMARTEGLDQYLAQQGIDSTQMSEFLKGFNEGAAKIDKKDVAYMAGLQVGQMVSKQWVEGFNQQIFGNDSTQSISRENLLAGFVAGVIGTFYRNCGVHYREAESAEYETSPIVVVHNSAFYGYGGYESATVYELFIDGNGKLLCTLNGEAGEDFDEPIGQVQTEGLLEIAHWLEEHGFISADVNDDEIVVCEGCGSDNIQTQAWVDPNARTFIGTTGIDRYDNWCDECEDHQPFCTLKEFKERMEEWWNSLDANQMEQITGCRQDKCPAGDNHQGFAETCNEWLENKGYDEKRKIWKEHNDC